MAPQLLAKPQVKLVLPALLLLRLVRPEEDVLVVVVIRLITSLITPKLQAVTQPARPASPGPAVLPMSTPIPVTCVQAWTAMEEQPNITLAG